MRLLVLSFYFPPDLSAGSFRTGALVEELSRRLGPEDEVRVLTTQPNRYRTFDAEAPAEERSGNVRITRFSIAGHRSGMLDQARAYVSYALPVLRAMRTYRDEVDLVFATSSRLMTAALAARVARRVRAPLYLDLRDLFPENLSQLFAKKPQKAVVPLLRMLEARAVRSASRINVVSPGFVDYFQRIRSDLDYRTFTNGIDEEFLGVDHRKDGLSLDVPRVILYAGNIGEGQGLEHVVPGAAAALAPDYEFWIVGDGGRRKRLEARLSELGISSVRLLDPLPRIELIELYRRADVLFLHLNDYAAFRRVLPSKIFEYAATGKPLLAGVEGYPRRFLREHVTNAAVFTPCDVPGLVGALKSLDLTTAPRPEFVERFRRSAITREMAEDVLELAGVSRRETAAASLEATMTARADG